MLLISFFELNGLMETGADGLGDDVGEGRSNGLAHVLGDLVFDVGLGVNLAELLDFLVVASVLEVTAALIVMTAVVREVVLVADRALAASAKLVPVTLGEFAAIDVEGTKVAIDVVGEAVLAASLS